MMDTNGLPEISANAGGVFDGEQNANLIKQLTGPVQVTVSSVIRSLLDIATSALLIVVNTVNRNIKATPQADVSGVFAAVAAITNTKKVSYKPTAGQTGRSLEWEQADAPTSGFPGDITTMIDALIEPVIPKYTVESFAQRILAGLPEGQEALVWIDQSTGKVWVMTNATHDDIASELGDMASGDDYIDVAFSEPPATEDNTLIFEGGES